MEAANLEEAGITYRPYPSSAADHYRVSSRKEAEENLPPDIELFAEMLRSRARANNDAYEQEEA